MNNTLLLPRSKSSGRGSSEPVHVSSRANSVVKLADTPYYVGLKRVFEDPYHEWTNKNGFFQLGSTENNLYKDMMDRWLSHNGDSICGITDKLSKDKLCRNSKWQELKRFMCKAMDKQVFYKSSKIVPTADAASAIKMLSFCLADAGNAFLVPSPYDPELDRYVQWRSGVEIIPVPCCSADNFNLSKTALDRALNQADERGLKVRGVIISNPLNPVGSMLDGKIIRNVLDFATEKNIHAIFIEMLAGSTHGEDYFESMVDIMDSGHYDRGRIHIVYDISGNLSLTGFSLGVVYTHNDAVLAAAEKLTEFTSISIPTHQLLLTFLSNRRYTRKFLEENSDRVETMHEKFVAGLEQLGIECVKTSKGFYYWVNMRKFISSYDEKGELELWEKKLNVSKINVTPGSSCHCIEPGWFRFCFTALELKEIPIVMDLQYLRVDNRGVINR